MLAPDTRSVAIDLIRPPAGYTLDQAVLTTYSLDLEAMLALPLAVFSQADGGLDELLADPLLLLEALREAGSRVHVFVDAGGIAIPGTARPVYAMLETSVHPVRAPNGGVFHPKLWIARFLDDAGKGLLRVAVLSRNLTFDRSWDIALTSEGIPSGRRRRAQSSDLGDFLRALPGWAEDPLSVAVRDGLETLAGEVERVSFPTPAGFEGDIAFEALGMGPVRRKAWQPRASGSRLLAIAPFVNRTGLEALEELADGERILVSRQEALDELAEDVLEHWDQVLVLSDAASDEREDEAAARPSGLHAKCVAVDHGWKVTWSMGSANLTAAAFRGRNVEVMASVTGSKGRRDGRSGVGIDRFLASGFETLCEPYRRGEHLPVDAAAVTAQRQLEAARDAILSAPELRVVCTSAQDEWHWQLVGGPGEQEGVQIFAWPISIHQDQAREFVSTAAWKLPGARLTAFVAFRLHVPDVKVDEMRFTAKLPAEGLPEDRMNQVLRTLIDTPERFLRFLRALLGGLDGLADWAADGPAGAEGMAWAPGLDGDTLLEDLVRTAARSPEKLAPVRRLMRDLVHSDHGPAVVPDDFHAIWAVVEEALAEREEHGTS